MHPRRPERLSNRIFSLLRARVRCLLKFLRQSFARFRFVEREFKTFQSSFGTVGGITLSIKPCAVSLTTPAGSPLSSKTISPPSGAFVSFVTFANFKRQRICPRDMPVNSLQKNRIIRRNRIQILTSRKPIIPKRMIPTAPQNPFAFRSFLNFRRDSPTRFFQRLRTVQINAQKCQTDTGKMNMRVIKSGCHEFSLANQFPSPLYISPSNLSLCRPRRFFRRQSPPSSSE